MGNHVFISYARADQTYVRGLTDELRWRGFEVWLDDRIYFGDRWWRTIVQAIQECAALVVVMTPDSDESPWVEREILLAERLRKPIFPLLLRGQEFAIFINTQYANVTDGRLPPPGFYARLGRSAPPSQTERLTSRSQPPGEAWEREEREKASPPLF